MDKPTTPEKLMYEKRLADAKFALNVLIEQRDPGIYGMLASAANVLAQKLCMEWLDKKGLQHCFICPNSAPLLKLGERYYCKGHMDKMKQEDIVKLPMELVRP